MNRTSKVMLALCAIALPLSGTAVAALDPAAGVVAFTGSVDGNFGTVARGATKTLTFVVQNIGNAADAITITGPTHVAVLNNGLISQVLLLVGLFAIFFGSGVHVGAALGVLGLIARVHGFSVWKFIKYIKEELLIVLGTSSSESVLPRMMAKMENLGARKSVVGLVIPTGYSFNLDGTSIYLTMAAVFIAQATNTPMTLTQQLTLLAVLLLTSKGAAGVTGSGFIVLAATLSAVGNVPVAGLALILGIDRFMSEARALTNLVGNGVATLVVARWCGELDTARMQAHLNGETAAEADEPEAVLDAKEEHLAA